MKIALLGGTGSIGEGFALRLAKQNEMIIGSRDATKAQEAAQRYLLRMKDLGYEGSGIKVSGMTNQEAAERSDIILMTLPYSCVEQVIGSIRDLITNKTIITPVVPMEKVDAHFEYRPPEQGSAALAISSMVPDSTKVVAAYHNVPACKLRDVEHEFEYDTVICGDDERAKKLVFELTEQMKCMRPLDGGPLSASNMAESLTPMLLNLAVFNGMKDLGVKFQ